MKILPRSRILATYSLAVFLAAGVVAATVAETVRRDVEYLASPDLEGRMTGTPGEAAAVDYIAGRLRRIGALPLPGRQDYRLGFEFTAGTSDAGSSLTLHTADGEPLRFEGVERVQALSFSDDGTIRGPVVFAGYGLSLPEEQEIGYNSYVGLDVRDKIVVVLRYFPEDAEQELRSTLSRYSGLRYKAMHARELGARALLVVTGPRSPNAGETVPMTFDTALSGSGLLCASIGGEVAEAILGHVPGKALEQVQESLDGGNPHVTGFDVPGLELELEVRVRRERKTGHNVVAYLPATGRDAAGDGEEFVLLGAHLDHLGRGRQGNSLADKKDADRVHHGADDNASGVAAVLAAAERLAAAGVGRRPVLLGFWSGEELGLLGSTRFLQSKVVPTERILAYMNFDMVGRMEDNRLTLQAVGSSSTWPRLIEQTNVVVGFDVRTQADPYLPTDAAVFYQAGVPTINFFTGSHADYHRPSDTADRINYEDLERVARFAAVFAGKLCNLERAPDYLTVVRTRTERGDRDALRAFTGTIPNYTEEVQGLLLSGVIEGGPADRAGLREGDVIVGFAGQTITNIYDYTYALDSVKIDQPVEVIYEREGKRSKTTITPTARD